MIYKILKLFEFLPILGKKLKLRRKRKELVAEDPFIYD